MSLGFESETGIRVLKGFLTSMTTYSRVEIHIKGEETLTQEYSRPTESSEVCLQNTKSTERINKSRPNNQPIFMGVA